MLLGEQEGGRGREGGVRLADLVYLGTGIHNPKILRSQSIRICEPLPSSKSSSSIFFSTRGQPSLLPSSFPFPHHLTPPCADLLLAIPDRHHHISRHRRAQTCLVDGISEPLPVLVSPNTDYALRLSIPPDRVSADTQPIRYVTVSLLFFPYTIQKHACSCTETYRSRS